MRESSETVMQACCDAGASQNALCRREHGKIPNRNFLRLSVALIVLFTTAPTGRAQIMRSFWPGICTSSQCVQQIVDSVTPANPPSGSTKFYTKGGTLCALSSAGTETCITTGGGGGVGGAANLTNPNAVTCTASAGVLKECTTGTISTSLAIAGATIGSNALAVTGSSLLPSIISASVQPASDSTTAFRIFKADGATAVLTVDTTNAEAVVNGVGGLGATYKLLDVASTWQITGGNVNANQGILKFGQLGTLQWTSVNSSGGGSIDTGLSRDAAGVIDFGTGAQGSKAGSWNATNGVLSGTFSVTGNTVHSSTGAAADSLLTVSAATGGAASVSPNAGVLLHIVSANSTANSIQVDTFAATPVFIFRRSDGTIASKTAVGQFGLLGQNAFVGWDGTTYGQTASLDCYANQAFTNSAHGTACEVQVTPNGSTTSAATVTFAADGTIGITGIAFASLPASANGSIVYCNNCNSTCTAGASTGRICFRENGAWTH